jgi:Domain of unknown function (DUF4382)
MEYFHVFRLRENAVMVTTLGILAIAGLVIGCGGGSSSSQMPGTGTGTVMVSISDPPSCKHPKGDFAHVYITVRSVQAHLDPNATDSSSGWQELAPQLANQPMQIDLFSDVQTNCVLAQLGSASLPVGSYQQIRLLLVSNSASGAGTPSTNACAGNGFNCLALSDGTIHELALSSQANTGLKIPPGQIVGGPIQVVAGQSVDLNIDFNACASIVQEGNGKFRLKPTLTAGQISLNNSGIGGQVIDSITKTPIAGTVLVAVEQPDSTGVDRIVMETSADTNGNFRFCPLPPGTFDIIIVAVGPNNVPYNATAVVNVPNGTNLNIIPLIAEVGAPSPAILSGFVTASTASGGATVDVSLAALQSVSFGTSMTVARQLNIPLQMISATTASPAVTSTGLVSISSNMNCPPGSPSNANCSPYNLVVPASNPSIGIFTSSGIAYVAPAAGDVLFTVDTIAAQPLSGGTVDCIPPEQTSSKDINNQPLKVTSGGTTNVARIDYSGCT